MFNLTNYLKRLKNANVPYEKGGTGAYKGDYYVSAGSSTPHIHVAANGMFVGLKGKKGAITTLVNQGTINSDTVNSCIDDFKLLTTPNETNVKNGLLELARLHKLGI